jgi:uncharacterized protein with NRDE domain
MRSKPISLEDGSILDNTLWCIRCYYGFVVYGLLHRNMLTVPLLYRLGLTKQGRLACLTNYRESGALMYGTKSRGGLPKAFLTLSPSDAQSTGEFARHMVEDVGVADVGGFSLVFGKLSKRNICAQDGEGLAIISNRTEDASATTWICGKPDEIQGLSNSHFGDRSWPKVVEGEKQLSETIQKHAAGNWSKEDLLNALFGILSHDTLPHRQDGQDWETYVYQLRNSIFIPRIGKQDLEESSVGDAGRTAKTGSEAYGTQKQTVILVDRNGTATYVEKTLYDDHGLPTDDDIQQYEFKIKGWNN